MKDSILVTGSTAIDQTGVYPGSFDEYQSRYRVTAMNASFQLSGMRTSFGGCAPNIAFGLQQLGVNVYPLSSAGRNFRDHYEAHLQSHGICTDYITVDEDVENCASCLMINDETGNQIIGFYPGPPDPKRFLPRDLPIIDRVALAILGPEAPDLTLRQGKDLKELGIPLMVDPGQVTSAFSQQEAASLLSLADYLLLNDHEYHILKTITDLTDEELLAQVDEVVITHGDRGVGIFTPAGSQHVDAVPGVEVVDVTGSGDAFRAGYAYGVLHGLPKTERAQLGCLMAMMNLQAQEPQGYRVSLETLTALQQRYYPQPLG